MAAQTLHRHVPKSQKGKGIIQASSRRRHWRRRQLPQWQR